MLADWEEQCMISPQAYIGILAHLPVAPASTMCTCTHAWPPRNRNRPEENANRLQTAEAQHSVAAPSSTFIKHAGGTEHCAGSPELGFIIRTTSRTQAQQGGACEPTRRSYPVRLLAAARPRQVIATGRVCSRQGIRQGPPHHDETQHQGACTFQALRWLGRHAAIALC